MPSNFHTLFLQKARLMVVVLAIFAYPTLLNAQSVLTDDAYTKGDTVSRNFGSNPTLNVSPQEIAYVKFKVSRPCLQLTSLAPPVVALPQK